MKARRGFLNRAVTTKTGPNDETLFRRLGLTERDHNTGWTGQDGEKREDTTVAGLAAEDDRECDGGFFASFM